MQRTTHSTRKVSLYGGGRDGFTDGVPGVEAATVLNSTLMNSVVEELARGCDLLGVVPDVTHFAQVVSALQAARVRDAILESRAMTLASTTEVVNGFCASPVATTVAGGHTQVRIVAVCSGGKTMASMGEYLGLVSNPAGSFAAHVAAGSSYTLAFRGVISANDLFIAFGRTGEIQTSPISTALTWTRRKTAGADITNIASTASGTSRALDAAGHIWTSTDGLAWLDAGVVLPASGASDLAVGVDNNGSAVWVAAMGAGGLYTSTNGTTYTQRTIAGSPTIRGARYCPDIERWIAVGNSSTGPGPAAWTSLDTITWTSSYTAVGGYLGHLTTCPGGALCLRFENSVPSIAVTSDGKTWRELQGGIYDGSNTMFSTFDSQNPVQYVSIPGYGEGRVLFGPNWAWNGGTAGNVFRSARISP